MKKRLLVGMLGICLLFAACAKKEVPPSGGTAESSEDTAGQSGANQPGDKTGQAEGQDGKDSKGDKDTPQISEAETEKPQDNGKGHKQAGEDAPDDGEGPKQAGEDAPDSSKDSQEAASQVPEVTFVDYSQDIKMESKDWILLSVQENCPVISIPGNEAAAEKMNLVFEQQHASNQTYIEEDKGLAQSAYEELPDEQKAEWTGYGYGATYKVMYCSANILSIACDSYEWQGTPHPNTWTTTYCFDVPTGKLLTLADIFTDKAKAGEIIDQHILDTITAEPYKDYLLEGYEDFVSDILREDVFYLNDKGMVVICNPYMVTAYAGGIIEIEVPYQDLEGVMDPAYVQKH